MQLKNIFFIVLSLICTINHQSFCMEQQKEEPKDDIGSNLIFKKRVKLMMNAIMQNDTNRVKQYIQQEYPLYFINKQSESALGTAAFNGNVEIVQAILEAYPNDQERKVSTNHYYFNKTVHEFTLTTANSTQIIKKHHTDFGYAPLHWACGNPRTKHRENDVLQIVKLLLDHDADPSYSVSDLTGVFHGTSPIEPEKAIDVAYLQGFTRVVTLLKNAEKAKFKQEERKIQEVFLDKILEDFFENAEKEGEKEEIDDIQLKKLSKELFVAAKIGNPLRVENLLRQGVPATHIDTFSFLTPLSAAANTGSYKVVELLLKNGVDPNYQYIPEGNTLGGPTALHALCRNNNIDGTRRIKIASLLLAHGARTDLPALDPRIISRRDRRSPHYNHPADLVENCPELMELLYKTPTTNNSDQCCLLS